MPGLERRLKAELSGDVHFDRFTRGRYCNRCLALPDHAGRRGRPAHDRRSRTGDRDRPHRRCQRTGQGRRNVAGRPDGRGFAGRRLLQVPHAHPRSRRQARALHGRAGHRARRSQPPAQRPRAVVSGRYLDRLARHHRRHGGQQFLRRPLDALRHHARQRRLHRGRAGGRHAGEFRSARRQYRRCAGAAAAAGPGSARHRRARGRRNRGALSESAAPGRRLQSRRAGARQERHQPRRTSWSARRARSPSRPASNSRCRRCCRAARSARCTSAASTRR